jgi:secreted trypsin-like serine protease
MRAAKCEDEMSQIKGMCARTALVGALLGFAVPLSGQQPAVSVSADEWVVIEDGEDEDGPEVEDFGEDFAEEDFIEVTPDEFNDDDDGDGVLDAQEDSDADGIFDPQDLDHYARPAEIPTVEVPASARTGTPAPEGGQDVPYSIGGNQLRDGDTPWQAQIYGPFTAESWEANVRQGKELWQLQHKCGGTLISAEWVLTAAHCIDEKMVQQFYRVRLGATDISQTNAGSSFRIDRIVRHAGYVHMYANDIALIHIVADEFTVPRDALRNPTKIRAIGLNPKSPAAREPVFASGWGRVAPSNEVVRSGGNVRFAADGDFPNAILLKVELNVLGNSECATKTGYEPTEIDGVGRVNKIHPGVICAAKIGKSTCKGDSGGPLVSGKGRPTLIGIVSWGKDRCTGDGMPSIYTSVAHYRSWISRAMQVTDPLTSELE